MNIKSNEYAPTSNKSPILTSQMTPTISTHNASAKAWLTHSATTIEAQQNLLHHNTADGALCPTDKILPPNNPEGTPSLLTLGCKVKVTFMPHLKVAAIKIFQMNLQWKKTKFIGKLP